MDIIIDSDSDDDFIPILACIICSEDKVKRKKRTHRYWVRPWIADREKRKEANTIFKLQMQLKEVSKL